MMNCGVIMPEPGYLQGLKDLCHEHGAYLAFDEVKTGATTAYGGAVEVFGVTPDIECLATCIGGGRRAARHRRHRGAVRRGRARRVRHGGHVQRNPLTMAASRAALTEVLTTDAYWTFNAIDAAMKEGLQAATSTSTTCPRT